MSDNKPPDNYNFFLGKIDAKMKIMMEMLERSNATFAALELRIRALEHDRAWLIGAAAVLSAVISILVKFIL